MRSKDIAQLMALAALLAVIIAWQVIVIRNKQARLDRLERATWIVDANGDVSVNQNKQKE